MPDVTNENSINDDVRKQSPEEDLRKIKTDQEILQEKKEANAQAYKEALAIQTNFLNPNVWQQIKITASTFFESKALPSCIQNVPQAVMVIQAGYEMGMSPIEAIQSLYIVKGAINIWGKAITKRFREHGWSIEYKDETDNSCTAIVSRGKEMYSTTFTFEMAEKSGHTKSNDGILKLGWKLGSNRKLKLRYGALNMIIKSYLPDVLGSAGGIKEFEEDEVVEGEILDNKNEKKEEIIDVQTNSSLKEAIENSRKKKTEPVEV